MSSSNSSDPRLLLPEWLRDGDIPSAVKAPVELAPIGQADLVEEPVEIVEVERAIVAEPAAIPSTPFSDQLSLDTRLDPGQLVSAADLPKWLGGLDRLQSAAQPQVERPTPLITLVNDVVLIDEPEPYDGVDAPEDGVIDVQINGWIMVAGALGLLVLLAAALELYLS